MHEKDDDFAFVTAGSHSTYPATLEFIFSIQYFYPESSIAVYDIGLIPEEKDYVSSGCMSHYIDMASFFYKEICDMMAMVICLMHDVFRFMTGSWKACTQANFVGIRVWLLVRISS